MIIWEEVNLNSVLILPFYTSVNLFTPNGLYGQHFSFNAHHENSCCFGRFFLVWKN